MHVTLYEYTMPGGDVTDKSLITAELYSLIGSVVTEFIRENRPFKAHDITLVLHTMKSNTEDAEYRKFCETAIRLLADLMH